MARTGRPRHPDILTTSEWEIVDAVRHGMPDREIVRRRGTSRGAVKFHLANIRAKLGVPTRQKLRHWPGVAASSPLAGRSIDPVTTPFSLGPIGQIALTVSSLERAEPFYRDSLGLKHLYTFGNLAFFDCHGVRLFLTASDDASHARQHSVVYFQVPDIAGAYESLRARDVPFEGAPHLIHKHADGTEEWMAFFNDPDGNLLAIMAQARP
ncbi:MAG: VOC family protein [Dehalococcoidia bacterium]|nr:VOC family protein [Thermoflexaceae bacterium]